MGQGVALSDWQAEQIRSAWLLTGSAAHGAKLAGCNPRTAQRYVATHLPELAALADEKRPQIADALAEVARALVAQLLDGKKLADARLVDVATALGIVIDKRQLLTGAATARTETGPFDPDRLSPDQQEQMAALIDLGTRRRATA